MSRPTETLADYVLGALSADETRALEAHLETCETCRQEVYRLKEALYVLLDVLPLQTPPAGVWHKVQGRRQRRWRGRLRYPDARRFVTPWLAAVFFSVLLVGGLGWGLERNYELRRLESEQGVLTAWMNNPELTIRPLSTSGEAFPGILCTYPDGRALLVQKENPPRGTVYRVWGVTGTNRTVLGTTKSRILRLRSEGFDAVEVGLEPRQSSEQERPTQIIGRVSL